ncbi:MAG: hypothetical protein Q4F41_09365 [Eubacteriales bacterium]|nr:hypothetical protein [Eubacteriales bacterium]
MGSVKIQENVFGVENTPKGVKAGKSFVRHPPLNFKGGDIPWFDDTKLIRKEPKKDGGMDE